MSRRTSSTSHSSEFRSHFPNCRQFSNQSLRVTSKDGKPVVSVQVSGSEKTFTPEEISAMVLGKVCFYNLEADVLPSAQANSQIDEGDR